LGVLIAFKLLKDAKARSETHRRRILFDAPDRGLYRRGGAALEVAAEEVKVTRANANGWLDRQKLTFSAVKSASNLQMPASVRRGQPPLRVKATLDGMADACADKSSRG
jgi:hypothetical protein